MASLPPPSQYCWSQTAPSRLLALWSYYRLKYVQQCVHLIPGAQQELKAFLPRPGPVLVIVHFLFRINRVLLCQ